MNRKKFASLIIVVVGLLICTCLCVSAAATYTKGYYQKTVYIQNLATGFYKTAVDSAVSTWNSSGIYPRSIVINNLSSSGVYDDDFTGSSLSRYNDSWGVYMQLGTMSTCPCHTTGLFSIFLNNQLLDSSTCESTAAHELGHALGLDEDQSSNLRLMSYSRDKTTVRAPIRDEVLSVVQLWEYYHGHD